jgi:hypothetical protein
VALIWESRSSTNTRLPKFLARQVAKLTVKVVFPTPPFILTVLITIAIEKSLLESIEPLEKKSLSAFRIALSGQVSTED